MDMQPIDPNMLLSAQLSADQWNTVLGHLDTGQHRVVRPIIDALMQQLRQQSVAPRFSTEDMQAARVTPDGP